MRSVDTTNRTPLLSLKLLCGLFLSRDEQPCLGFAPLPVGSPVTTNCISFMVTGLFTGQLFFASRLIDDQLRSQGLRRVDIVRH